MNSSTQTPSPSHSQAEEKTYTPVLAIADAIFITETLLNKYFQFLKSQNSSKPFRQERTNFKTKFINEFDASTAQAQADAFGIQVGFALKKLDSKKIAAIKSSLSSICKMYICARQIQAIANRAEKYGVALQPDSTKNLQVIWNEFYRFKKLNDLSQENFENGIYNDNEPLVKMLTSIEENATAITTSENANEAEYAKKIAAYETTKARIKPIKELSEHLAGKIYAYKTKLDNRQTINIATSALSSQSASNPKIDLAIEQLNTLIEKMKVDPVCGYDFSQLKKASSAAVEALKSTSDKDDAQFANSLALGCDALLTSGQHLKTPETNLEAITTIFKNLEAHPHTTYRNLIAHIQECDAIKAKKQAEQERAEKIEQEQAAAAQAEIEAARAEAEATRLAQEEQRAKQAEEARARQPAEDAIAKLPLLTRKIAQRILRKADILKNPELRQWLRNCITAFSAGTDNLETASSQLLAALSNKQNERDLDAVHLLSTMVDALVNTRSHELRLQKNTTAFRNLQSLVDRAMKAFRSGNAEIMFDAFDKIAIWDEAELSPAVLLSQQREAANSESEIKLSTVNNNLKQQVQWVPPLSIAAQSLPIEKIEPATTGFESKRSSLPKPKPHRETTIAIPANANYYSHPSAKAATEVKIATKVKATAPQSESSGTWKWSAGVGATFGVVAALCIPGVAPAIIAGSLLYGIGLGVAAIVGLVFGTAASPEGRKFLHGKKSEKKSVSKVSKFDADAAYFPVEGKVSKLDVETNTSAEVKNVATISSPRVGASSTAILSGIGGIASGTESKRTASADKVVPTVALVLTDDQRLNMIKGLISDTSDFWSKLDLTNLPADKITIRVSSRTTSSKDVTKASPEVAQSKNRTQELRLISDLSDAIKYYPDQLSRLEEAADNYRQDTKSTGCWPSLFDSDDKTRVEKLMTQLARAIAEGSTPLLLAADKKIREFVAASMNQISAQKHARPEVR